MYSKVCLGLFSLCFSFGLPAAEVMAQCNPKFSSLFCILPPHIVLFNSWVSSFFRPSCFFFVSIFLVSLLEIRVKKVKMNDLRDTVCPSLFQLISGPERPHTSSFWLTDPNNFALVLSHAVWAQDVFIYKVLCIIDALLLLLGTALSEMATSKTLHAVCLWKGTYHCMGEGEGVLCNTLTFWLLKAFHVWLSSNNIFSILHFPIHSDIFHIFLYFQLPLVSLFCTGTPIHLTLSHSIYFTFQVPSSIQTQPQRWEKMQWPLSVPPFLPLLWQRRSGWTFRKSWSRWGGEQGTIRSRFREF